MGACGRRRRLSSKALAVGGEPCVTHGLVRRRNDRRGLEARGSTSLMLRNPLRDDRT